MKINVNGREMDYDEAIRFIEEEKTKAVLSEKEQKLNEIVKKNLVVAKVKELQSGMEHFILCFAPEDMKYDYAMGSIERHFGPKYCVGEKRAFKRYKVTTIDKPEEGLINLAKKFYGEDHRTGEMLSYTPENHSGAVRALVFDYMPREANAPDVKHRAPAGDDLMQELCNLIFKF